MPYNTCAIVTVYFPSESVLINIEKLEAQVSLIVIADNTPCVDNFELFASFHKVRYQANKENLGLSKAFNQCLRLEAVKDSDFILFLDQDSLVSENLLENLIDEYDKLRSRKIDVACIGPVYYEKNAEKLMIPTIKKKLYPGIYEVNNIITSSMLTTYSALSKVNFWNESIFLDMADWDLCWRFISVGLKCYITQNVILSHTLGKSVKKIGPFSVKEGAVIREYYQTRDCLKLLLKKYTPLKYKIRFILMTTVRPIIHVLFLSEKLFRIKYIFLGIIDFFHSVNGSFEFRKI